MDNLGEVEVHSLDDICSQLMKNYGCLVQARLNTADENKRRRQLKDIADSLQTEAVKIKNIANSNNHNHNQKENVL